MSPEISSQGVDVHSEIAAQRAVADKILGQLHLLDPNALVAGGAPRDWYLRRIATDIDVFIHFPRQMQGQGAFGKTLGRLTGTQWVSLSRHDDSSEYEMNPGVEDVYESYVEGFKIQVIRLNHHAQLASAQFPLSLSQVTYTAGWGIYANRNFELSVKHKAIFKILPDYDDSHKYIAKIRKQFPEYEYFSSKEKFYEAVALRSL
jgi:hypothetical protein